MNKKPSHVVILQTDWELNYLGQRRENMPRIPFGSFYWRIRRGHFYVVVFLLSLDPLSPLWPSARRPVSFLWRSCWLCMDIQCQIQRRRPVKWLPACRAWHWTRWDRTQTTPAQTRCLILIQGFVWSKVYFWICILTNNREDDNNWYMKLCVFFCCALCCALLLIFCWSVKDQLTEDLFPGEEEEESSPDDLTPSVTSNTSDVLRHLQGITHTQINTWLYNF